MAEGYLLVTSISSGSVLGVIADRSANLSTLAYEMTLFANRAGGGVDAPPDHRAQELHPVVTQPPTGAGAGGGDGPPGPDSPVPQHTVGGRGTTRRRAVATPGALRPFVLTSGRVQGSDPDIGLETQVTARPAGSLVPLPRLSPELAAIVSLCAEPLSVAEISARLRLHLGVAKILVGDLRVAGYVDVHTLTSRPPMTPTRFCE